MRYIKILAILFSILFLSGCINNKQNLKFDLTVNKYNQSTIKGNIVKNQKSSKNIYVILYKHIEGNVKNETSYKLIDFSSHSNSKKYEFNVTEGTYFLYACQNLEVLKQKRFAYEFYSNLIKLKTNEIVNLDIKLSDEEIEVSDDNILIASISQKGIFDKFGEVRETRIEDTIFDRKKAIIGLWKPLEFFSKYGGGLYLLDEYSEDKIPVLFVHGMSGTPRDFEFLINSLDKTKYLPIVYFYPTGINLNYAVDGLKYSFEKLRNKYEINDINIVAHSMGGLVSRGFINVYAENIDIKSFSTIATPWNGQKFAEFGKNIVPSFSNMAPGSAFQTNILNKNLPNSLDHYLFFAYKGKNSLILDSSNDGVISLSSQLFEKAQEKAALVYGFNETHVSILKSKLLSLYLKEIISK